MRILVPARARELEKRLPGLLRDLEESGCPVVLGNRSSAGELSARAGSPGIAEARQVPTDRPGSIYILPPDSPDQVGGYMPLTGDPLAEWLVNGWPTRREPTTSTSSSAQRPTSGTSSLSPLVSP